MILSKLGKLIFSEKKELQLYKISNDLEEILKPINLIKIFFKSL